MVDSGNLPDERINNLSHQSRISVHVKCNIASIFSTAVYMHRQLKTQITDSRDWERIRTIAFLPQCSS